MPQQAEGSGCRNATLILPALVLFAFPSEALRFMWAWVAAATLLLLVLMAALVVRSLVLPFTDPEMYQLARRPRLN